MATVTCGSILFHEDLLPWPPVVSEHYCWYKYFLMSIDSKLIIDRLKELQSQIPSLKQKRVSFLSEPEFEKWHHSLVKWLTAGGDSTVGELKKIEYKSYTEDRIRYEGEYGYTYKDEQIYQKELD